MISPSVVSGAQSRLKPRRTITVKTIGATDIPVAKSFVRLELAFYRHSGGSRNPDQDWFPTSVGTTPGPRRLPRTPIRGSPG